MDGCRAGRKLSKEKGNQRRSRLDERPKRGRDNLSFASPFSSSAWDPMDVQQLSAPLCKSFVKGKLARCERARVNGLTSRNFYKLISLVTNCIVCIYEWEQQRRPTDAGHFSFSLSGACARAWHHHTRDTRNHRERAYTLVANYRANPLNHHLFKFNSSRFAFDFSYYYIATDLSSGSCNRRIDALFSSNCTTNILWSSLSFYDSPFTHFYQSLTLKFIFLSREK